MKYFLDMVLDIHAHTALTGLFIYGNSYDDVYRYERHIVFPKILAQNCEDFSPANTIYNADQKKNGSVRRHMTSYLSDEVNTYTIEVSLLGYEDREKRQIIPYTDELYAKIGRNVTRALWDYYKIVGTIPLEESSDEESGIPKPLNKPSVFKNFNMDRLKEVERQRQETAATFEEENKEVAEKKTSVISVGSQSKAKMSKKKDFIKINSEKIRTKTVAELEDDYDMMSSLSVRNESSGENDYISDGSARNSDKILTPIVSLEMDDNAFDQYMSKKGVRNLDDDVDFFFNNNQPSSKRSLQRQDSLEGYAGRKSNVSVNKMSYKKSKTYFSSPLASLHISKIGGPDDTDQLLSQTLSKTSLGLDALHPQGLSR